MKFINSILFALAIALSLSVIVTNTGCAGTGQIDVQDVQSIVDKAQQIVDKAQASVTALQARLATLPADAPERKALDKSLIDAQAVLSRAQFDLELAKLGFDVFSPLPATQPAK